MSHLAWPLEAQNWQLLQKTGANLDVLMTVALLWQLGQELEKTESNAGALCRGTDAGNHLQGQSPCGKTMCSSLLWQLGTELGKTENSAGAL